MSLLSLFLFPSVPLPFPLYGFSSLSFPFPLSWFGFSLWDQRKSRGTFPPLSLSGILFILSLSLSLVSSSFPWFSSDRVTFHWWTGQVFGSCGRGKERENQESGEQMREREEGMERMGSREEGWIESRGREERVRAGRKIH